MRILIIGIDGYLGWSLAQHLGRKGYTIGGVDCYFRRLQVSEMNSISAIPISDPIERVDVFREKINDDLFWKYGNITNWDDLKLIFEEFKPDTVVHLGENPSAPYSMIDRKHSVWIHQNNVIGSLNVLYAIKEFTPKAHLVKLGTMGEYGQPNVDIPEGYFELEYRGRKDYLPFPRQAGSWYHQTKVHDTNNTIFACKIWGLRSTDIMQGVVYGTQYDRAQLEDARFRTRLDFDECFGTAINRFVCQAVINEPITTYGLGKQKRGFLPLRDSIQCLTIAVENPPGEGEYRTFNQFEETYTIIELAEKVKKVSNKLGLDTRIAYLENPRIEKAEHYFNPDHNHLLNLGYEPTHDMENELEIMISDLMEYKNRIKKLKNILLPKIRWNGETKISKEL